jgi:choline/glycine/proline betaine transport protein
VTLDKLDAGFFGTITAFIAPLVIATYFITSSDSGTLVITTILSMGNEKPLALRYALYKGSHMDVER